MTTRRRWTLWLLALAVTGYLAATTEPATEIAAAVADVVEPTDGRAGTERGSRKLDAADVEILALRPRTVSAETRALFAATSWAPPPPKAEPPPQPPPTAPALPFRYLGKQWTGELWEVFVSRGEQTLLLRENQTVEATYRIDSIKPPQMVLTYLPLNEQQTMNIGAAE